jgi:hypothetical protein
LDEGEEKMNNKSTKMLDRPCKKLRTLIFHIEIERKINALQIFGP